MSKLNVLSPDELELAITFMGCSNLALTSDKELREMINNCSNFKQAKGALLGFLGSMAESDEMYTGFLGEINSFRKSFRGKEKKYWFATWEKDANLIPNIQKMRESVKL